MNFFRRLWSGPRSLFDPNRPIATSVFFYPNGVTAVTDQNGKQMPELQEPWCRLFAAFLESNGHNPTRVTITFPNERRGRFFRTEHGYNWEFLP